MHLLSRSPTDWPLLIHWIKNCGGVKGAATQPRQGYDWYWRLYKVIPPSWHYHIHTTWDYYIWNCMSCIICNNIRYRAPAPVEWQRGVLVLISQLTCFKGPHKLGAWFFYFNIDFLATIWYCKSLVLFDKSLVNESRCPFSKMHLNQQMCI